MPKTEASAATPDRQTELWVYPEASGTGLRRSGWNLIRREFDMCPKKNNAVWQLPSGAICACPSSIAFPWTLHNGAELGVYDIDSLTVASGVAQDETFKVDDVPGQSKSTEQSATVKFLRQKTSAITGGFENTISSAHPSLTPLGPEGNYFEYPLGYKAQTNTPEPADTALRFSVANITPMLQRHSLLAGFVFGGDTEIWPPSQDPPVDPGDNFSLNPYKCGTLAVCIWKGAVTLYERLDGYAQTTNGWVRLPSPSNDDTGGLPHGVVSVHFIPYQGLYENLVGEIVIERAGDVQRTHTARTAHAPNADSGSTRGFRVSRPRFVEDGSGRLGDAQNALWPVPKTATGSGQVEAFHQLGMAPYFQMAREVFSASGQNSFDDADFQIPFVLSTTDKLWIRPDAYCPAGCAVNCTIYNAKDGTALAASGDGSFSAPGGSSSFYAHFQFTMPASGGGSYASVTPVLFGYQVFLERLADPDASVEEPEKGGNITSVRIAGATIDPRQDHAELTVEDVNQKSGGTTYETELQRLRQRGRVRCRIVTHNDPNTDDTTTLFDGETYRVTSKKQAKVGMTYPAAGWRVMDASMNGMWSRITDQLAMVRQNFLDPNRDGTDDSVWEDPGTYQHPKKDDAGSFPWRCVDALRWYFNRLGYPNARLDLPSTTEVPFRLYPSGVSQTDGLLNPCDNMFDAILNIVQDYMGAYIFYDPNAGDGTPAPGMWRVKMPPTTYTPVWDFYTGYPTQANYLAHSPGAYGPSSSPVVEWSEYIIPPEFNYLCVTGVGQVANIGAKGCLNTSVWWNENSFKFRAEQGEPDSSHIDYLGRFVPAVIYNPRLANQKATDFICKTVATRAGHGQRWIEFVAPLPLITDASDTYLYGRKRPLRVYDCVNFHTEGQTYKILLYACDIEIQTDRAQFLHAQGYIVT